MQQNRKSLYLSICQINNFSEHHPAMSFFFLPKSMTKNKLSYGYTYLVLMLAAYLTEFCGLQYQKPSAGRLQPCLYIHPCLDCLGCSPKDV